MFKNKTYNGYIPGIAVGTKMLAFFCLLTERVLNISKKNSLRKRFLGLLGIVAIFTILSTTIAMALPFNQGDVFAGIGNGQIRHYDKNGNFIDTLIVPSLGFTEDTGMAFDASGNLYATAFQANKVAKFNSLGVFQSFFGSGYNEHPESILFDAIGNVYVGQADSSRKILKFDLIGNSLASFSSTKYLSEKYKNRDVG